MAVQTRLQTREDRVAERAFRPSFIHLFAPLCERTKQSQRTSRKKEQERGLRIRAEKMCPLASPPSVTDYDDGVTVTRQERRIPRETGSSRRVPSSDRVSPPPALSTAVRNFQADATARANGPLRWLEVTAVFPRALRRDYEADPETVRDSWDLRMLNRLPAPIRCFVEELSKSALCWIDPGGFATRPRHDFPRSLGTRSVTGEKNPLLRSDYSLFVRSD